MLTIRRSAPTFGEGGAPNSFFRWLLRASSAFSRRNSVVAPSYHKAESLSSGLVTFQMSGVKKVEKTFKSAEERLVDYVFVRLKAEERQKLEALALANRQPLSTVARDLLLASLTPAQQPQAEAAT